MLCAFVSIYTSIYLLISKQTLKYNLAFSYRLNASCEVLYLLSLSPLSLSLSLIMVQWLISMTIFYYFLTSKKKSHDAKFFITKRSLPFWCRSIRWRTETRNLFLFFPCVLCPFSAKFARNGTGVICVLHFAAYQFNRTRMDCLW